MIKFSEISGAFAAQPMFEILSAVQDLERKGRNILHFELGEPDFDTPANIQAVAVQSILNNDTKYAPSSGLYDLKEAVQTATFNSRGFKPTISQILVTPGANSIIYLALKCVLEPGDEVIVPDPGFPTYFSAINAIGGVARSLRLDPDSNFGFEPDDILKLVNHRTRAIIVNSPSNPTGQLIEGAVLREVFEIAKRHDILLISDEIYSRIKFSDTDFVSPSSFDNCCSNTLILNGFSKAFSMTGWRLGVAIGPELLMEKMSNLTSTLVSCVPPFIQRAGIEAIVGDQSAVDYMVAEYKRRANLLCQGLNEIQGIECHSPKGAIYVFPKITGTGYSSAEFCNLILSECSIAATPGHFFGTFGEGFVRFSTVNNEEQICLAVERLKNLFGTKN